VPGAALGAQEPLLLRRIEPRVADGELELPQLPSSVHEVMGLVANSKTDRNEIVEVIGSDPVLSSEPAPPPHTMRGMGGRRFEPAPLSSFPPRGPEDWARRASEELGGAAWETLRTWDPTGIAREPLYGPRDLPPGAPIGRRARRGWLRVEGLAPHEPPPAPEEDAQRWAFEVDGEPPPGADPARWLLASHAEPARALGRAYRVGGYDPLGAAARWGAASEDELGAGLAALPELLDGPGRPLRIDLGAHHGAGAHAVQELAWMLATLAEYARAAGRGRAGRLAAKCALAFEVGRDLFDEVAKLRAARALWARFFGALGLGEAPAPWIHATTARRTLARVEPETNLLRATSEACAAAFGGADSIRVRPHDEASAAASPLGRRLARNAQRILAEEAHLERVADPAGGSYLVEARSAAFARAAWEELLAIEARGGMRRELAEGRVRAELDRAWERFCARVEAGEVHVLGVTLHAEGEAPVADGLEPNGRGAPALAPLPLRREGSAARRPEVAR